MLWTRHILYTWSLHCMITCLVLRHSTISYLSASSLLSPVYRILWQVCGNFFRKVAVHPPHSLSNLKNCVCMFLTLSTTETEKTDCLWIFQFLGLCSCITSLCLFHSLIALSPSPLSPKHASLVSASAGSLAPQPYVLELNHWVAEWLGSSAG